MQFNILTDLSVTKLKQVIKIRERVSRLEKQLSRLLGGNAPATNGSPRRPKRRMSAAAKARISKAAKARWAKFRAQKAK